MRSRKRVFAALMLLVLIGAACSGSSDGGVIDNSSPNVTSAGAQAFQGEVELQVGGSARTQAPVVAGKVGDGGVVAAQAANIGRNIIFTADMTVAVSDVAATSRQAISVINGHGGFLFGQRTLGGSEPSSVLTFKIPPENFLRALDDLGTIGEVRDQRITADDVTERIVDLESRIVTAEASVSRLRAFLEQATDVKTVTQLETQLLQRETDLETMRGQLRTTKRLVDLATIVINLTEAASRPAISVALSAYPGTDGGASCPGASTAAVDEGDQMTVCWEVTNTGDTALTEFAITDNVLGIELKDLLVVFGDPSGVLETGQSFVVAHEIPMDRNLRTQTRITASPADGNGAPVSGRAISDTQGIALSAIDSGDAPGFRDSFGASVEALQGLIGFIGLAAGAAVPFLWVPIVVWVVRRRFLRTPEQHATTSALATGESP